MATFLTMLFGSQPEPDLLLPLRRSCSSARDQMAKVYIVMRPECALILSGACQLRKRWWWEIGCIHQRAVSTTVKSAQCGACTAAALALSASGECRLASGPEDRAHLHGRLGWLTTPARLIDQSAFSPLTHQSKPASILNTSLKLNSSAVPAVPADPEPSPPSPPSALALPPSPGAREKVLLSKFAFGA